MHTTIHADHGRWGAVAHPLIDLRIQPILVVLRAGRSRFERRDAQGVTTIGPPPAAACAPTCAASRLVQELPVMTQQNSTRLGRANTFEAHEQRQANPLCGPNHLPI